ncbi:hypothetical protein HALDL1_04625 [Halobacterium sp. DL1]|nr:hypothetical protein HALDL1_04625 [Halobacterium sp. DL1]
MGRGVERGERARAVAGRRTRNGLRGVRRVRPRRADTLKRTHDSRGVCSQTSTTWRSWSATSTRRSNASSASTAPNS